MPSEGVDQAANNYDDFVASLSRAIWNGSYRPFVTFDPIQPPIKAQIKKPTSPPSPNIALTRNIFPEADAARGASIRPGAKVHQTAPPIIVPIILPCTACPLAQSIYQYELRFLCFCQIAQLLHSAMKSRAICKLATAKAVTLKGWRHSGHSNSAHNLVDSRVGRVGRPKGK